MTITARQATIRLLPSPDCEPPFDDEIRPPSRQAHRAGWGGQQGSAVQGTLALAFVLPSGIPASPIASPELRLLSPPRLLTEFATDEDAEDFGPQPTGRAVLPEPRSWAGQFAQALVEVLCGDRPLGQLVRFTSAEVYDEVACRVLPAISALSAISATPPARRGPARGVVRSVHLSEPCDGVAEVTAVVRRGARTTAIALRLEGLDGRWQCTALEMG